MFQAAEMAGAASVARFPRTAVGAAAGLLAFAILLAAAGAPAQAQQEVGGLVLGVADADADDSALFTAIPMSDAHLLVLGEFNAPSTRVRIVGSDALSSAAVDTLTFEDIGDVRTTILRLDLADGQALVAVPAAPGPLIDGLLATSASRGPGRAVLVEGARIVLDAPDAEPRVGPRTPDAADETVDAPNGAGVFDSCDAFLGVLTPATPGSASTFVSERALAELLAARGVPALPVLGGDCTPDVGGSTEDETLTAEITRLREIDRAREDELSALNDQVEQLTGELADVEAEGERQRIADEVASAREAIAALNDERGAINERIDAFETRIDELKQERERQEATLSDRDRTIRRGRIIVIAIGAGGVLVLGLAAFLALRSRGLRKELVRAEQAVAEGEARWNDCVLEGDDGVSVKLPGSKLLRAHGGVVVGRSRADADVVLDFKEVSRSHARFEVIDEALHVTDLGSTNGTRVNGKDLAPNTPTRVRAGDTVALGSKEFKCRILSGEK